MNGWQVIGIDPAPSKDAAVYDQGRWQRLSPTAIRDFIIARVRANPATLVAWDAPLSFDRADLYDRAVDKEVRAWVNSYVLSGRFAKGAINVRCFAGLPHWTVSCLSLGLPFGTPPEGLRLARTAEDFLKPQPLVIEVHPAVAIGAWWLASGCTDAMPKYKRNPVACARIAAVLGFPPESGLNDDNLDSFVAYRLGELFILGQACWIGNADSGGYVMPNCSGASEILNRLAAFEARS